MSELERLVASAARCARRGCRSGTGPRRRVLPRRRRSSRPATSTGPGGRRSSRGADDIPVYDRVFRGVLRAAEPRMPSPACSRSDPRRGRGGDRARQPDRAAADEELRTLLRDELAELGRADARLRLAVPSAGRGGASRRARGSPDLRRTLRRSLPDGRRAGRARVAATATACAGRSSSSSTSRARWTDYSRALVIFAARARCGPTGAGRRSASARG